MNVSAAGLPGEPETLSPPVFYKLDSTRVTLREYSWGTRNPLLLLIAWLLQLFRVRIPGSSDDPAVEWLHPFEVHESDFPEEVKARFAAPLQELTAAGFQSPVYHLISDAHHSTTTHLMTLVHASGRAVARIHERLWARRTPPRQTLFVEFISPLADGSFLWSLSAKPDLMAPPSCRVNRLINAPPAKLWASHQAELQRIGRAPRHIAGEEAMLDAIDQHHGAVRAFHVARGVFAPLTAQDQQRLATTMQARAPAESGGREYPEVMEQIEQLQKKQSGWMGFLLMLVVSMLLFMQFSGPGKNSAGSGRSWNSAIILVGVLLFHEGGHYLAMRLFRYRNVRMFFIPFFGAAVSGQNYNVPGWKKALVSLMGPVPGIFAGIALGIAGMVLRKPILLDVAVMALILNGFNLLPVLPLDGGHIMHTILFCRNHLLDTLFRLAAAVVLIAGGGLLLRDRFLPLMGVFMLLGLPLAHLRARIAAEIRREGLPAVPDDNQGIPAPVARAIIARVSAAIPRGMENKVLAQHTLQIYEAINARPPGWIASIGLAAVHGLSFALALVFGIVFILGQRGDFVAMMQAAAEQPKYELAPAEMALWRGPAAPPSSREGQNTIIATVQTLAQAKKALGETPPGLPPDSSMRLFGQSVLLALPTAGEEVRNRLLHDLGGIRGESFVDGPATRAMFMLSCIAPDEAAAEAVEQEARGYLNAPNDMHLVPPWTAVDPRTVEERALHRRARYTWLKLQAARTAWYGTPNYLEWLKSMRQAREQEGSAEVKRLTDQMQAAVKEAAEKAIHDLRQEGGGKVDLALIGRYEALLASKKGKEFGEALVAELGPRLGQLPLIGGKPAHEARRFSADSGLVHRNGTLISLRWLRFADVVEGPAAVVTWLESQGCNRFRYRIQSESRNEDPDDVALEE